MTQPVPAPATASPELVEEPALRVDAVTKTYGATTALQDVSLSVRRGSVHALLGANGSGKSTLIKILAGVTQATAGGDIHVGARHVHSTAIRPADARHLGMRFVHQQLGLFPGLTLAENVAAATGFPVAKLATIPWRDLNRRTGQLLEEFGLQARPTDKLDSLRPSGRTLLAIARAMGPDPNAQLLEEFGLQARPTDKLDSLRPSGRTLLAIARAMGPDPNAQLLVLDEPTASLPEADAHHLLDTIKTLSARGITTLIVTHRLGEVAAVADDVTVLRDGAVVADGPLADFPHAALVGAISPPTRAGPRRPEPDRARRPPSSVNTRRVGGQLHLRGLHARGVHDIDLDVADGEILGLAGLAGSGRTALLETIFGVRPIRSGEVELGGRLVTFRNPAEAIRAGVALVPEDRARQAVFNDQPLTHNVTASTLGRFFQRGSLQRRAESRHAQSRIQQFGVKAASGAAPISTLSGGNQQKTVLARWLDIQPRVLLLDEPTQGVDVGARADIHQVVRSVADTGAVVLLVSSDLDELCSLSNRIVLMVRGRLDHELPGPFSADAVGQRMHAQT